MRATLNGKEIEEKAIIGGTRSLSSTGFTLLSF